LTFTIWKSRVADQNYITIPNGRQEKVFRSCCYGARCYKSKSYFESQSEDDYMVDEDVVSLYPTAMRNFVYPVGRCFEMTEKQIDLFNNYMKKNNKMMYMGCYYVKYITNKYLAHSVLPKKSKTGLVWDLYDGEGYYNSVDIDNALNEGYKIQIIQPPNEEPIGFYWTQTENLFTDYIDELFNDKKNSKKKTAEYAVAKLFMNGLYGKMIQRPICTHDAWVKTNSEFWKFYGKYKIANKTLVNEQLHLTGIPRDEVELEKSITKPTHLGSFILSYSRRIMLEYFKMSNPYFNIQDMKGNLTELIKLQMENDFYYTDTDSIQLHQKNKIPTNSEVLGGLSNDLGEDEVITKAIYIAPKLYMLQTNNYYHFKGKGVDNKKLNEDIFNQMNLGNAIKLERDFQMKKLRTKKNSNQEHIPHFSIQHITGDKTARTLNNTKWNGRYFIYNESIPYGHIGVELFNNE
jgi:hypothetical protein